MVSLKEQCAKHPAISISAFVGLGLSLITLASGGVWVGRTSYQTEMLAREVNAMQATVAALTIERARYSERESVIQRDVAEIKDDIKDIKRKLGARE